MDKPIISMTLAGVLISKEPWKNAHKLWFKDMAARFNDNSLLEWIEREDYFNGVDIIMERLYPDLSEGERTKKARDLYFRYVYRYIMSHIQTVRHDLIDYVKELKNSYRLAIITTNTEIVTFKFLKMLKIENLFDLIICSKDHEKDDKKEVFNRLIKNHENPILYIGSDRKESLDFCKENNIKHLFVDFDTKKEGSIQTLIELKEKVNEIIKK